MDEMIVIDTPEGIEHFRLAALIAALRIEVKTGMVGRMPTLPVARSYGVQARTKKKALEELEGIYMVTYGRPYGS